MGLMSLDLNLGWFWWICRDAGIQEEIENTVRGMEIIWWERGEKIL